MNIVFYGWDLSWLSLAPIKIPVYYLQLSQEHFFPDPFQFTDNDDARSYRVVWERLTKLTPWTWALLERPPVVQ
jgi:hypothetical protein